MARNKPKYSTSMLIGKTASGVINPVFFDLHTPILNNKPPGCIVTGAPGSGKTYASQLLVTMSAILGKTVIVLDIKGDFMNLRAIQEEIKAPTRFIDIGRKKGALDPFAIGDDEGDKLGLALQIISILVGGISKHQRLMISPIIRDLINTPGASMKDLINKLLRMDDGEVMALGGDLKNISILPYANLFFAPGGSVKSKIDYTEGITVFPLMGLDMPTESEVDRGIVGASGDNIKHNLSSAIIFTLTDLIRRMMKKDTDAPKVLMIDEAWALTSNEHGRKCIKEISLLGRSKNVAMILASQKNTHFESLDFDSTISTRFCFNTSLSEAEFLVREMQLPENEGFESILTSLETGTCLMRDWDKGYAVIEIIVTNPGWHYVFRSDPEKAREEREKRRSQERSKKI